MFPKNISTHKRFYNAHLQHILIFNSVKFKRSNQHTNPEKLFAEGTRYSRTWTDQLIGHKGRIGLQRRIHRGKRTDGQLDGRMNVDRCIETSARLQGKAGAH